MTVIPGRGAAVPAALVPGNAIPGNPGPVAPTVVNQTSGSTTGGEYGFHGIEATSTTGNTLVLVAAWDLSSSWTPALMPAAYVSDSAGNYWVHAGTSDSQTTGARVTAWVCCNARAITWVSCSLSGFATSLAYTLIELSGAPAITAVDCLGMASTSGISTSTSLGTSASPSTSGIGFAVLGIGDTTTSVTASPAAWTQLSSVSAGSGSGAVTMIPYLQSGVTAGTLAASWTFSAATHAAAVIFSIQTSPAVPVQRNPNFPLLKVELGLGHLAGDTSSSPPTWTDVTTYAMARDGSAFIKTSYGREYELSTPESGEMSIMMNNLDGRFTPGNSASPYYTNAVNSNYSFETGTSPWSGSSFTIAQSSLYAYSGTFSMQLTPLAGQSNPFVVCEHVAVSANLPYTASVWVYAPGGYSNGMNISLNWFNAASAGLGAHTSPNIVIPAGVWTQIKVTGAPPASAVTCDVHIGYVGTPATTDVTYLDLAGFAAGGAPVQAGLVRVLTPVRVSGWWSGQWWHVSHGYVERWPNTWPDLAQWGFSEMVAMDAIGVLSSVAMPSALAGDVLVDAPYMYFHGDEQYSTISNSINPTFSAAEANGLPAINYARNNQRPGFYVDGSTGQVQTGLALNLSGDNGTGFGASGVPTAPTSTVTGAGIIYTDPNLPNPTGTNGLTVEFWFQYASGQPTVFTAYGPESNYRTFYGFNTPSFAIGLASVPPTVGYQLVFNGAGFTGVPTFDSVYGSAATTHAVCVFSPFSGTSATFTMYLDGGSAYTTTIHSANVTSWTAVALGCAQYAYSWWPAAQSVGNFSAGHYAIYSYALSTQRITNHYEVGALGDQGDTAMDRIAEILTWGNIGIPRGGPLTKAGVYDGTFMAQAYSLEGSSAADAINQVGTSDRGLLSAMPSGTLQYLFKWWALNVPSSVTFGDNTPMPLNLNPDFSAGTTGWSGNNATLAISTSVVNATAQSAFLTPLSSVSTANLLAVSATAPVVTPNTLYTVMAWVYSPLGWGSFRIGVQWLTGARAVISTVTTAFSMPAGEWIFVQSAAFTAPSNAAYANVLVQEFGNPQPANTFYVQQAWLVSGTEVPFEQQTGFDFDNTYLYNNTDATLQQGASTLIKVRARDSFSQEEYFDRSSLSETVQTTGYLDTYTAANWDLNKYKEPQTRVKQLMVDSMRNPNAGFGAVLSTRVGDVCTVNRRPIGGAVISEACMVQKVQHDIGPGLWQTTYQLSPYVPENQILSLDAAGYDTLGSNTLS